MFLKIEQLENLIMTTMSLIYRNVPNGKHPYSQCIQTKNWLIVLQMYIHVQKYNDKKIQTSLNLILLKLLLLLLLLLSKHSFRQSIQI